MSTELILADDPAHTTNNFDASGNVPTPGYTDAEAWQLFALGLEAGPTPLTALDRSLGLRDGDLDLDPPDDLPPTQVISRAEIAAELEAVKAAAGGG